MEWVVQAISAIRALRTEMNVPPAARVPLLIKDAEPIAVERHRAASRAFHAPCPVRADSTRGPARQLRRPGGGPGRVGRGCHPILRLGDVVDLAKEKARLGKEIGRLDAELAKIAAKLANPDFLAKAKAEVVEEQREREADATRDRDRLKAAYDRLAATLDGRGDRHPVARAGSDGLPPG